MAAISACEEARLPSSAAAGESRSVIWRHHIIISQCAWIRRLKPCAARQFVDVLRQEHRLGHRLAIDHQHRAFALDPHVERDAFGQAGDAVPFARQQVDRPAGNAQRRFVARFCQRRQHRQRGAVRLAVIENRAHQSMPSMIRL
jgi:hypothetical protein